MCQCAEQLVNSMELYDPGVQFIVKQMPYEPKFLNKIGSWTKANSRCFDIAIQSRKNLITKTTADFDPATQTSITLPAELKGCVKCNTILRIGNYLFHVTEVDETTQEATLEVLPGQSIAGVIPAESYLAVFSNAQGICAWNVACTTFSATSHTINLQEIGDCYNHCTRGDELSKNGGMKFTLSWSADTFESMLNAHLEKLDQTMFGMIPTKSLDANCAVFGNYTANGYMSYVNQYGLVSDNGGNPLTVEIWRRFGFDMNSRKIRGVDCLYMNTSTWLAMQDALKGRCNVQCNVQAGSSNNTIGFSPTAVHIPGLNVNVEVILWDDMLQDGEIVAVSSAYLAGVTLDFKGQNWLAVQIGDPVNCGGGNYKYEFSSVVGLKLDDPSLTAKMIGIKI